ncbi:MAG: sigma-70 family RNA polymerase sigma factor [Steroidobacteraceae bacterium]
MQEPAADLIRSNEFASLMRAYQDMVYSTAARLLGNDAQAQDIAQDVFLKAYENFEQLRTSATIGGWLKTVATNLSLNHLTRYRRRWRLFSDLPRSGQSPDAPETLFCVPDTLCEGIAADERSRRLEFALRRLPDHQRVPLVLYHFEELSYQDIAQRLQVSLAKVKTDIQRARLGLAQLLQRPVLS